MRLVISELPVYGPATIKGQVDAIGAGPNYATVIGTTPFVSTCGTIRSSTARIASTLASATVRF
jgi:hypothetical protein